MGCDIHVGLETKDVNGKWVKANPIMVNLVNPKNTFANNELSIGRNYDLFSILEADHARNYNDIKDSIAPERGVPEDSVFRDYLDDVDFWGQSYVTVKEIKEFALKHPTIKCSGYVSKEDYEALKNGKITSPKMYWQGGTPNATQYHTEWYEQSPITYLATYLSYIMRDYEDQMFDQAMMSDDEKLNEKIRHCVRHIDENTRLVFAFDN